MALDRFVYFDKKGKEPTKKELSHLLKDFVGDEKAVKWETDRFFVSLPGRPSDPFRTILKREGVYGEERWIEVWIGTGCIDVLTRGQDPFTNAIAQSIAETVARYWEGKMNDGS